MDETPSAGYACWGDDIEPEAHAQMAAAAGLPIAASAALMPDAHVGYGLPIGGVLATRDAVIPYAVGVDIACRVMLTVFDLPAAEARREEKHYASIIESCTLFGVGKGFRGVDRAQHAVMDEDWSVSPVTRANRDKAWEQLGTSGSGNHFVEFGEFEAGPNERGIPEGAFLAVVSHSGSRGTGAAVCDHYSKVAMSIHADLPKKLKHLAWLPLAGEGSAAGQEYWAAMELMGKYASANHHVIHSKIIEAVGASVRLQVENHHNFAWKETHAGRELIVHRKGATPAGSGVLGYIPGTMAAPGYLVEGLGEARSLDSASHGAGRKMSRTKAKQTERWDRLREFLKDRGVSLLSAGLDESPNAYKDIDHVMAAQSDLVRKLGRFTPRIVKMAPDGERAED
jgi:tRNA-splicing ligase RtcB (3'-phosphate/5'-hydroxy nucleic acid ligase)